MTNECINYFACLEQKVKSIIFCLLRSIIFCLTFCKLSNRTAGNMDRLYILFCFQRNSKQNLTVIPRKSAQGVNAFTEANACVVDYKTFLRFNSRK